VYKFDGTSWSVFDTTNSGIPSSIVNDIEFDSSGNAWCATRKGISRFDGSNWTNYTKLNSGLPSDSTYCVFIHSSNIWIGTKQGLAKFDGTTWTLYNVANSGLVDNFVTAIDIDSNGDVWIGTNKGLSVMTSTGWLSYTGRNSNLVDGYVTSIYIQSPSVKWIAVKYYGLFKLENGVVFPQRSFFRDRRIIPSFLMNSISKGPQSGVLLAGSFSSLPGLIEIAGSQVYFYPFPSISYVADFHNYDSLSNRVWFMKSTAWGSTNTIFSFDFSSFTGLIVPPENPLVTSLDINQVKAGLLNRGDMHWDLDDPSYEVPKNSGRHAIFNSALWLGGVDNGGSLRLSAMTYRQTGSDFWPGPLDTVNGTSDSATMAAFDKIWKLDRWQIEEFRTMFANGSVASGTYIPDDNIINWPAHGSFNFSRNLAPFVDVNGDGFYNPMTDGDYPKIKGDQMCYWIFNDNLSTHSQSGGVPFKVEVHASAYAYTCEGIDDSLKALNYTTFYSFDLYNRSLENYHDVYLGIFSLHGLGGYYDDYTGCNKAGNYSFEYNGDEIDESLNGWFGYGDKPPIASKVILDGPKAVPNDSLDNNNNGIIDEINEVNLMTHYHCWIDGGGAAANSDPTQPFAYYNLMHSVWNAGDHATYGGYGYGGTIPTNFIWDGIPGDSAGWSQWSLGYPYVDYRMITSTGPFNFNAGERVNFDFAYVFTRDTDAPSYNINDLFYKNWEDVKRVQRWYAADSFPSCDPPVSTSVKDNNVEEFNYLLFPNPSNNSINLKMLSHSTEITTTIYDISGKQIKCIRTLNPTSISLNISDLDGGLYLIKITDGKNSRTKRFVKQ
jgi:hypothetical protein